VKAIILASGEGKRLRPYTEEVPKCLIDIGRGTILDIQLKILIDCGIQDAIITTGPFEEKIILRISDHHPNFNVDFVKNPLFQSTNYIYSLWLTKNQIDDDILLIHGDMVLEKKLMKRLLDDPSINGVLVNKFSELPEKDFKAKIENGRIMEIGTDLFCSNCVPLLPVYKFSKSDFNRWISEIDDFIERGLVNVYAEEAFNSISNDLILNPVYFHDEFCMEIDTVNDLMIARNHYTPACTGE